MHGVGKAPGKGKFSFESDRGKVGKVLERVLRSHGLLMFSGVTYKLSIWEGSNNINCILKNVYIHNLYV